ncbi:hypothetical protein [Arcticibacter tournemirensis]|uniref:hypothetical protein n=1 Tax=Arcticibacter tournemirensis TaxID=699437 RepID=UPI00192A67A8|nr:hypothetical protein [Arcticibacter tournemirensis]
MNIDFKMPSTTERRSRVVPGAINRVTPVIAISEPYQSLKNGIWAYFILLLIEGALRKWFFPSLSTPLLIIRDPLAIWLLVMSYNKGVFPNALFVYWSIGIGVISTFTALFAGHGNFIIAIYGARILLFHFPLIFIIGEIFTRGDVIKLGKFTLWVSIPMAVLVMIQFYSPQSAWVNRGIGGDMEGAGFSGALGFYRSPATFSFTNGTHLFFGFAATFILYFWFNSKEINKAALILATIGLLSAIPFSISRSLLFHVLLTVLFSVIAAIRNPRHLKSILLIVLICCIAFALLSNASFFQTAMEAFTSRFETASDHEGGLKGTLGDRFLGGMITALSQSLEQPYFGLGIGMGTNVASKLLSGDREFLVAEEEWARTIGELGPLLGLSFILLRVNLSVSIAIKAFKKLKSGDILPWMLASFGLLSVAQEQTAQPTSLGFCVVIGGLLIASFRYKANEVMFRNCAPTIREHSKR